jgi:hypothetical protein
MEVKEPLPKKLRIFKTQDFLLATALIPISGINPNVKYFDDKLDRNQLYISNCIFEKCKKTYMYVVKIPSGILCYDVHGYLPLAIDKELDLPLLEYLDLSCKQWTDEIVKTIADWAFCFHRRNDLNDEELEIEFEKNLEVIIDNVNVPKFYRPELKKYQVTEEDGTITDCLSKEYVLVEEICSKMKISGEYVF